MNFCWQSGFRGFFTAWESTPSLPLITTPEMDLTAHSQGNQDCRPFLSMSSSVKGASTQGRRRLQKVDGTWSLELQRPRPNKAVSWAERLNRKTGQDLLLWRQGTTQRKEKNMERADSRLQSCWNAWVHGTRVRRSSIRQHGYVSPS